MVSFWDEQLALGIVKTKKRIKFCEKNGIGNSAMQEKKILEKQLRKQELRKKV